MYQFDMNLNRHIGIGICMITRERYIGIGMIITVEPSVIYIESSHIRHSNLVILLQTLASCHIRRSKLVI